MTNHFHRFSILLSCFAIASAFLGGCGGAQSPKEGISQQTERSVTQWEEAQTLIPVSGSKATFPELVKGKVALLDFWASWCEPCKEIVPKLKELHKNYPPSQVTVIGLNIGETRETARRYAEEAKLSYPVYNDHDFAFADRIGAKRIPSFVLLDQDGKIVSSGREPTSRTESEIATLLRKGANQGDEP